jgi:O-antigen/teichoic acid export membrane protein
MANKHKYLAKNVGLFSISSFVPKILSFVLIPIYTNCLTTAEYGVSDLLTTTVSLLLPFFTLDIQDAVMRFALDKKYEKSDVFTVALRIILIGTGLVTLGAFVASTLKIPGLENSYLIFFVLMYFTTALSNSLTMFCRGIDKVNVLVVGGILQSVIMLSANILFLVVFKWGLTGYLLANTLGSLVAVFWYFFGAKLHQYIAKNVSKNVLKDMVRFSFPLIFSVTAWWINSASDRYVLTWMSGVAISGLYAVSYKIPVILSVFATIFYQAWSISAIKEFDKDDKDRFISNMYDMMSFSMAFVCSCVIVLNVPVAKILYTNEFFEAYKFVPPLLIGIVFNTMALFIGSIFSVVKDTKTLSVTSKDLRKELRYIIKIPLKVISLMKII